MVLLFVCNDNWRSCRCRWEELQVAIYTWRARSWIILLARNFDHWRKEIGIPTPDEITICLLQSSSTVYMIYSQFAQYLLPSLQPGAPDSTEIKYRLLYYGVYYFYFIIMNPDSRIIIRSLGIIATALIFTSQEPSQVPTPRSWPLDPTRFGASAFGLLTFGG